MTITRSIRFNDLPQMVRVLDKIEDPELVVLKTHMLVERLLVSAAASRLLASHEDVPRFGFATLVELVSENATRKVLFAWNDMRNALAHEFAGTESDAFRKAFARLDTAWPLDCPTVLQSKLIHAAATVVLTAAMQCYLTQTTYALLRPPSPEASDSAAATFQQLKSIQAAFEESCSQLIELAAVLSVKVGERPKRGRTKNSKT